MPDYNRVVVRYSNGITEVKTYQYYQRYGYTVSEEKSKHNSLVSFKNKVGRKKGKKSDFNEKNVFKNSFRAKAKIRELCNNNSAKLTKFLTLTFAGEFNEDNINDSNLIFKKFIQRVNYRYQTKIEYICVPELTKKGNIHYHLICDLPYIDVAELQDVWGYGIIHITKIDDIRNIGAYLSSYVDKDFGKCFPGRKHFFKSKGIVYPVKDKIDSDLDTNIYNIENCVYSSQNENAFCGEIQTNVYDKNFKWK